MTVIHYLMQGKLDESPRCLNYSDLLPFREPAFVVPNPGEVIVGMDSDPQAPPHDRGWRIVSLAQVAEVELSGDAIDIHLGVPGSEIVTHPLPILLRRAVLLEEFHWIPVPAAFPQPLPRALWPRVVANDATRTNRT